MTANLAAAPSFEIAGRRAVTVPARTLTPGMDVLIDGEWRHLYSASTNGHYNSTQVIWEGEGRYTARLRRTDSSEPYTVAVPDITGLPAETPILARLDAWLALGHVTAPPMNFEEMDAAARYVADSAPVGASPDSPAGRPGWDSQRAYEWYRAQSSYDLANNYVHSRRIAAAFRALVALAGRP